MSIEGASRSQLHDEHADLGAYQDSLAVALIATPREQFVTCTRDASFAEVLARYRNHRNQRDQRFDHLPVVDGNEVIVGVLDLVGLDEKEDGGPVSARMLKLSEQQLIGADSSILDFIRTAADRPFRLVVSGENITGLVSISDLQRLPVRAALFAMVTHLEMLMADTIRAKYRDGAWLKLLSTGRAEKVHAKIDSSFREDAFVDKLLFTQFCDKRDILAQQDQFSAPGSDWESDMQQIEKLRNSLAHANEYAATRESARQLCSTVRLMDAWISELSPVIHRNG